MKQMAGLSDIIPGRTVRGGSALAARIWHIVISPKGSIPQDPTIGWGLPARLGTKASETSLKMEAAFGRDAIKRDPEVKDAVVTIEEESAGQYRVQITAIATDGAAVEINEVLAAGG
jgi:hypothetical protein